MSADYKSNEGYCVICENQAIFVETDEYLRTYYRCSKCNSVPRHRAIVHSLNVFYPAWREAVIYEPSPGGVSSNYIEKNCINYTASQFWEGVKPGYAKNGVRCENLEQLTFPDNCFDIIITQDVFEHVMNPKEAFKEIARVLKPGGAHFFTLPWYPQQKTVQRARYENGNLEFLFEPVYHINPVDVQGSLVTYDWGEDLIDCIYRSSGLTTITYLEINRNLGLDAEFLHVFISKKHRD